MNFVRGFLDFLIGIVVGFVAGFVILGDFLFQLVTSLVELIFKGSISYFPMNFWLKLNNHSASFGNGVVFGQLLQLLLLIILIISKLF